MKKEQAEKLINPGICITPGGVTYVGPDGKPAHYTYREHSDDDYIFDDELEAQDGDFGSMAMAAGVVLLFLVAIVASTVAVVWRAFS